ncbi:hypothetical protein THII_2625 [Thioploca ingrica]|uniref:Uncharacterized protein n=1 Tax=Thioploca ingrica TaxID=40754 RepID=A0A090AM23_9GAMM|nr:hypothetical protein THII_2625 [Thioploca ingrica]
MTKTLLSHILYLLAFLINAGCLLNMIIVYWPLLAAGKGFSSFEPLWYLSYSIVTIIIWIIAFVIKKHLLWSLAFWVVALIPVVLFSIFPIKFYFD